jgi:hypothetical protein
VHTKYRKILESGKNRNCFYANGSPNDDLEIEFKKDYWRYFKCDSGF